MKKSCFAFLLIANFLLSLPVHAQPAAPADPDYPTVAALQSATVPYADLVDLARRFRGVTAIPAPPTSAPTRTVGETQAFWVLNTDENREFLVDATLRVVGEHIYLWVQSDVNLSQAELQALASAFDTEIYPNVRELWGQENSPGIDGDTRQRRQPLQRVGVEGQWHQRRPRLDDRQAELSGDLVTEACGAHLGDRLAAAGNDQRLATHLVAVQLQVEAVSRARHALD